MDHERRAGSSGRLSRLPVRQRFVAAVVGDRGGQAHLDADEEIAIRLDAGGAISGMDELRRFKLPGRVPVRSPADGEPARDMLRNARTRVRKRSTEKARKPGKVSQPALPVSTAVVTPRPRQ